MWSRSLIALSPRLVAGSTNVTAGATRARALLSPTRRSASVVAYASLSGFERLPKARQWINEQLSLLKPNKVHVCDGSSTEFERLVAQMVQQGTLLPLDPKRKPGSYLARSAPSDVARVEKQTYICSRLPSNAGPTNNWMEPSEMERLLRGLLDGAMKGRTAFVIPFCMGPLGSRFSKLGIQITDSPYVVANMRIMTKIGKPVLDRLDDSEFVPCVHSVGAPLQPGATDVAWPCNDTKYIVHFPEDRRIISYGSGYGGNALLGKKCLALRIASVLARDEGWLAEHMLILGVTSPSGTKKYVAAAFPSACGKTNLAMLQSTLPGWKVETVGDDIAWMHIGDDGRLWAVNPESGFFGVAPGTSPSTNANALQAMSSNTFFTNVALTDDKDVWWEGLSDPPKHLIDWQGNDWTPASDRPAAHPNSRFTTPISQCPIVDPAWDDPQGVPISAILFGGRRSTTVPAVFQAFDWQHGSFLGASMCSEQTAAAEGTVGNLRFDPFAMLPFCGYHMGDYFQHWSTFPSRVKDPSKLPKIFGVNWFRRGADNQFLWPGFGDNVRILKWIIEQTDPATVSSEPSPIGLLPREGSIDISNLSLSRAAMQELFSVDKQAYRAELERIHQFMKQFEGRLPADFATQLSDLEKRLAE